MDEKANLLSKCRFLCVRANGLLFVPLNRNLDVKRVPVGISPHHLCRCVVCVVIALLTIYTPGQATWRKWCNAEVSCPEQRVLFADPPRELFPRPLQPPLCAPPGLFHTDLFRFYHLWTVTQLWCPVCIPARSIHWKALKVESRYLSGGLFTWPVPLTNIPTYLRRR